MGQVRTPPGPPRVWLPRDRRQLAAFLIFAVLLPALAGSLVAVFTGGDDENRITRTVAQSALERPSALRDDEAPAPPGADVTEVEAQQEAAAAAADTGSSGDGEAVAEQTEQSAETAATPATALERLRAWPNTVERVIGEGETLFVLALEYNTTVEAIAALNEIEDVDLVAAGQTLIVAVGFQESVEESVAEQAAATQEGQAEAAALLTPLQRLRAWTLLVDVVVQPGDALSIIALDHDTTIEAIVAYNDLEDAAQIFAGQTLVIPVGFDEPLPEAEVQAEPSQTNLSPEVFPLLPRPDPVVALHTWPDVVVWEILPGDNLAAIAREFGTSIEAVAALNGLDPEEPVIAGETLRVPRDFSLRLPASDS